jgi:2-aminoadipate transaminase
MQFADRLQNVETSAIRELFKLLGKPGIISFAGGFPDPALFDAEGIRMAAHMRCWRTNPARCCNMAPPKVTSPCAKASALHGGPRAATRGAADGLIVTTGSQQALDLIGKTMISPGDKVIVEAPTFLATIQCFRLYGAHIIGAPIDADGVDVDVLEALIEEHKPQAGLPDSDLWQSQRCDPESGAAPADSGDGGAHQTLVVEDDPYGELYFDQPPPPSLLALSDRVPGSRDWLAHCGSFSKILSPGLRVGWMIAPAELLAKATMCKQFSDAHTSNLTQAICGPLPHDEPA